MLRNIYRMLLVVLGLVHVSRAERKIARELGVSIRDYRKLRWRRHWERDQMKVHHDTGMEEEDLEEAYEKFVDGLDQQAAVYRFPSEAQVERKGRAWLRRARREGIQIARR